MSVTGPTAAGSPATVPHFNLRPTRAMNLACPTVESVIVRLPEAHLPGELVVPPGAAGLVVFAHGSGSSHLSPRNRLVAHLLQSAGFGTLLIDLLTRAEDANDLTHLLRFDVALLARRLLAATEWLLAQPVARALPLGFYGASTGAAAALRVAALRPGLVRAIVSRGGRPDLAAPFLPRVTCPTLLIVGGWDDVVLQLNREALPALGGDRHLEVIPHATHLFAEPGALDAVAHHAAQWFARAFARAERPGAAAGRGRSFPVTATPTQEERP